AVRSTADVVAEAESHKRLVLAVMQLDEPYRSTVLLRWFEDLPPREVAARLGVPVETVRTRLKRANDALRARLETRGAGWAVAIAPLVGSKTHVVAAAKSAGGAFMASKTAYAVAAVAVAFAGGMVVRDVAGGSSSEAATQAEVAELRARLDAVDGRPDVAKPPRDAAASSVGRGGASRALDERVAAQETRIAALETSLAAAQTRIVEVGAAAKTASLVSSDVDPAERAKRLKAMTDDELLGWLDVLMNTDARGVPTDGPAVVEASEILLGRALDATKRAKALTFQGYGRRVLRDFAGAETSFRDAMNATGPKTKEGRWAAYQLAWTTSRRGDARAAAEAFVALASDEDDVVRMRAKNRMYAASHFEKAGDKERSLAEYRKLVEDFGSSDDAEAKKTADYAKEV